MCFCFFTVSTKLCFLNGSIYIIAIYDHFLQVQHLLCPVMAAITQRMLFRY